VTDRKRKPDEDVVDWAVATSRIGESRKAFWRSQLAAGKVSASAIERLASVDIPAVPAAPRTRPLNLRAATAPPEGAGAWSPNPIVAAARSREPRAAAAASTKRAAPTLFAGGDLPPFTASGVDPQVLLQVPWLARHPVAAAGTTAEAYKLLQDYSGPDAEVRAAMDCSGHPANRDYQRQAENWLADGMTDDENYAAMFGENEVPDPRRAGHSW